MRTHRIFLLPVAALVLSACNKDKTLPVDLGYAYFPTDVGRWIEYQVDSMWYDEFNTISGEKSYRLRETVFEVFTDPEGRAAQRVRREIQDTAGEWHTKDIWWQTRDNYAAEKTEENLRRLKLSFPVGPNRYWNANVYNSTEELELTYEQLHQPWSSSGLNYDSTVVVQSTYPNNYIDTIQFEERWAKHVGMVSKNWIRSNSQYDGTLATWLTEGWRVKMTAVAYGQ